MYIVLIVTLVAVLGIVIWALFGKGEGLTDKDDVESPDRVFRRRATDQEIEKRFPDQPDRRARQDPAERTGPSRMSDSEAGGQEVDDDFELPYKADEIISDSSRFRIYKRTLINSEIYARNSDFATAISLYEGVNSRINDENTNRKIEANIEYLKKFQETQDIRRTAKDALSRKGKSKKTSEIKLTFDGPVSLPENLNIGLVPPPRPEDRQDIDVAKIVDEVTRKIEEKGLPAGGADLKRFSEDIDHLRGSLNELKEVRDTLRSEVAGDVRHNTDHAIAGELAALRSKIENLACEKERLRQELESMKAGRDSGAGDAELITQGLDRLSETSGQLSQTMRSLEEIARMNAASAASAVADAANLPATTEAKYTAAEDLAKLEDLLSKVPRIDAPDPRRLDARPRKGRDTRFPDEAKGDLHKRTEALEKIEKRREDETEEIELLSDYIEDKPHDTMSDEEIFEKILQDRAPGDHSAFEIIGDRGRDAELPYDATIDEMQRHQQDEMKFYEKFLKHDKRKRKELPILKVSYDFSRLPDEFSLARDKNILEYSFYKYKGMLEKANDFIKKRKVRDAINYYKVVMGQNIPPEFKSMIRKNINDLTEYLEKYLTAD